MSFSKSICRNIGKNISSKYSQKNVDHAINKLQMHFRVTDKHDNKERSLEERQKIIDDPR